MNKREEFVRYIRKTGTSLGVNIPLEVIKILNLKENEIVRVTIEKVKQNKWAEIKDFRTRSKINRFLTKDGKN